MTGSHYAAMLLAAAALTAPTAPHGRLMMPGRRRGRTFAATAVTAVAVAAISAPPSLVLVFLILAVALAARVRRQRRVEARRVEGRALASALDVLVGELKIGAHPMNAFTIAGKEAGGQVGRALCRVATRAQLGADVGDGIRATALTSAVPAHWARLAVFWQLAAEHGLAMSVLMRAAHRDIVDRQRFADRMHAALAGARVTAVILASLPALGVLLGQLIGADPVRFLLGGGLGGALLVLGVFLICVGVAWADRIVERLAA